MDQLIPESIKILESLLFTSFILGVAVKARIASSEFWDRINLHFGSSGGIYKVSCLREEDSDESIPVQRLLAEDLSGVLYIGMAVSFLDRVIELKKSISPKYVSRGHECGARLKEHAGISSAFPYEQLVVSFIGSDLPRDAERQALQKYFETFGELPPLNRAG